MLCLFNVSLLDDVVFGVKPLWFHLGSASQACYDHLTGLMPGQVNPPNRKKPGMVVVFEKERGLVSCAALVRIWVGWLVC